MVALCSGLEGQMLNGTGFLRVMKVTWSVGLTTLNIPNPNCILKRGKQDLQVA